MGDATISYVDERPLDGSVDAPTLLLVHGTPTWSYLWRAPIAELRRTHRVIALDLPGFGDSTAPLSGGHAFSVGARLIAAFIERLGLRNLVVVMHATAGPMAIGAALADPARVRGLVITNSFAWPLLGSPGKLGKIARLVSSRFFAWFGVQSGLLGWITARFSRRNGRFSLEERRAIAAPLARRSVRAHLADVLASLRGDDRHLATLERDVGRSLAHIPALLLYGMHDNGYRAGFLARWQSLLPIHQVVLLERAGHFPPEDQPQEWTDAVTDFVARL
ncbi:MAG: alpha/beta fold hydrolase [Polyangiaceae bacterium]